VDVAGGQVGGDFSCVQVLKIGRGQDADVQVAEWHGYINPTPLAHVTAALGFFYNMAQVAVECNGMGVATNNELFRLIEYENIYRWKHIDKVKNFITDHMGWYTNYKTRDVIIAKTNEAVMDRTLVLRSERLIGEMKMFSREEEGSRYEGHGTHDDRVFALMIARYCAHESDFGRQAAMQPSRNPGGSPSICYVFDEFRRMRMQEPDELIAQKIVEKNPGWSYRRMSRGKDFFNTEYSPIHAKAGLQRRLFYEDGVPAEYTREMSLYAQMNDKPPNEEDMMGDWRNW